MHLCVEYVAIEILASSNTCWSSVVGDYALDYKFSAPYNGILSGVRLVHNSGSVSCKPESPGTNWGCYSNSGAGMNVLFMKLGVNETTTRSATRLYPTSDTDDICDINWISQGTCGADITSYFMNSYDLNSDQLVFISSSTNYTVSIKDQFFLDSYEPVCSTAVADNTGIACATVYFLYSKIFDFGLVLKYL